jgi:hypothetical protein
MKIETISCRFIGDFKVGDNMVYNAGLLCKLAESGSTFNKLMLLQAGAITEAALWEIIYRAQNFNREVVPNISEEDRVEIEGKKVERFKAIIDVMKKYAIRLVPTFTTSWINCVNTATKCISSSM